LIEHVRLCLVPGLVHESAGLVCNEAPRPMKKPGRPLGGYRVQAAYWLAAKILFQRKTVLAVPRIDT